MRGGGGAWSPRRITMVCDGNETHLRTESCYDPSSLVEGKFRAVTGSLLPRSDASRYFGSSFATRLLRGGGNAMAMSSMTGTSAWIRLAQPLVGVIVCWGISSSPYQPTEPELFRKMLASLIQASPKIDFREFTFIDIGSGKGRALLMAADYPFRRILGIELLPDLHRVARREYQASTKAIRSSASPSTVFCATPASFLFRRSRPYFICSIRCPSLG